MGPLRAALVVMMAGPPGLATAALPCDGEALHPDVAVARDNIIAGIDGVATVAAWRRILDAGGTVAWPVTEYKVDARSTFVFAFDREALRVYRAGAFSDPERAAPGGCLRAEALPEAVIPWSAVREIEAANWVVRFRLRHRVEIRSDRERRKRVDELKAFFHGAPGGDLTYSYTLVHEGRVPFWNVDVYRVENLRGVAVGPTDFQRRLQYVIASAVDPGRTIALKTKSRGAGW